MRVVYAAKPEAVPLLTVLHRGGTSAPAAAGLVVRADLPQLGGPPVAEHWLVDGPMRRGARGSLQWASTAEVLCGALELPAGDGAALEKATRLAYRELLAAAGELGYPSLLRIWNVVPQINRLDGGLERYRRFCRGRAEAFEGHHGPLFQGHLCASSAVGGAGDALTVWFLAGRQRGLPRENPRQVSAYAYPPCYGPRSPSFARATHCPEVLGGALLLSGTASIVGHVSLHPGDVLAQLEETLRNLSQLLPPSDRAAAYRLLKVYVRRTEDAAPVRAAIEERLGAELPVLYLQADICRHELLLEIEGVA